MKQQTPELYGEPNLPDHNGYKILAFPILSGNHHREFLNRRIHEI